MTGKQNRAGPDSVPLAKVELIQNLIKRKMMMLHNFSENGTQSAGAKWAMVRNGQVMLAIDLRRQASMGTKLPDKLITKDVAQCLFQFTGRQIPW